MENFFIRILKSLPSKKELKKAISHFSKREYFVFISFVLVLCISTLFILESINKSFMIEIPMQGGTITEGIIGTPRFIDPALAFSDVDQDLVSLIYSGLMRKNSDGALILDLAQKYEVSKDNLTYTFTLKDNIFFHDKKPVTVDDLIFTINKIKDPITKSSKKRNWDGVTTKKIDEKTIKFILKQPYASFLENTTLGIMPAYLWNGSPIELNDANINPIGSGPYKISKNNKQSSGLITSYNLTSFKEFALGKPYITNITLRFYSNEDDLISALERGEVDQISSITPQKAEILREENYRIESSVLPRIFGLFFNQNQNQLFVNKNIISAINLAIDKNKIVNEVLSGYGIVIDNPIPSNIISYQKIEEKDGISQEEKTKKAVSILEKDGWKKNESGFLEKTTTEKKKKTTINLEFSISTGNAPELAKTALLIKQNLENIGIRVNIKTFEIGNLNEGVIRPRKYDALLFGEIINHESDLFAFWHSSQRKDPGLNVAMYTNAKVDKILGDVSTTINEKEKINKYAQFENEIKKDMPAIFLYSPSFIYLVSKELDGFSMKNIITPGNRFLGSYLWYTKVDNVWKIFSK
ncbi:MAG: ABC transporter substrate-binding protein [Candidatus Paceibacterota bacterium]